MSISGISPQPPGLRGPALRGVGAVRATTSLPRVNGPRNFLRKSDPQKTEAESAERRESPVKSSDSESKLAPSPILLFIPLPTQACVHVSGTPCGHLLCAVPTTVLGAEGRGHTPPPHPAPPHPRQGNRGEGTPSAWDAMGVCALWARGPPWRSQPGQADKGNSMLAHPRIDTVYLFCRVSVTLNLGGCGGASDGGPEAPAPAHGPFNVVGVFHGLSMSSVLRPSLIS